MAFSIRGFLSKEAPEKYYHVGNTFSDAVSTREKYFRFTLHESFPAYPKRIRGEYRTGSTIVRVDESPNGSSKLLIQMEFTDPDEANKLYNLIRSGKTWPTVCYGDEQVPAPCRHLKDLFREAFGIIRRELARKLHFA